MRIAKWGNSLGVRIPRAVAREVGLDEGVSVEIKVSGRNLVLAPIRREYCLNELVLPESPRRTVTGRLTGTHRWVTRAGERGRYVTERGDILWLTFDPQAGHEQAGRRPAAGVAPQPTIVGLVWRLCARLRPKQKATPSRSPCRRAYRCPALFWRTISRARTGELDGQSSWPRFPRMCLRK